MYKRQPEKYFVGRYGGDEFIALLNDVTQQEVEDIILQVQNEARCYNEFSKQIFIDFAFGYALSTHGRETNLKLLLNQADKNMYAVSYTHLDVYKRQCKR